MKKAKEKSNYTELKTFLNAYVQIPSLIEHKKKLLRLKLINPQTSVLKGYHAFVCKENEINYLVEIHSKISSSIKKLKSQDRCLCELILKEPNIFRICGETKISKRTFYRKVENLWNYFQSEINQKEIIWER